MIGDSLAVGTARPLVDALPGWDVHTDGRTSRPLADGMEILSETHLPRGDTGARAILAFSLFTNNAPSEIGALEEAVRTSVRRLGSHGCAIWATIVRPPFQGQSYGRVNALLESLPGDPELSGKLLIVPWAREVASHHEWLAGDHVHATPEGYGARAQLFATAAQTCGR
jgi:hypothetical protein